MDSKMKMEVIRIGAGCMRKSTTKPPKWRLRNLQHFNSEQEAFKPLRSNAVKTTIRKYIRHQQRKQLVKLAKGQRVVENCEMMARKTTEEKQETHEKVAEQPRPQGAMAPMNTTQYLMDLVYDDLPTTPNMSTAVPVSCDMSVFNHESLLSRGGYVSLDYESSLVFQQRDFDEMFRHFGSHWSGVNWFRWMTQSLSIPVYGDSKTTSSLKGVQKVIVIATDSTHFWFHFGVW